MKRPVVLMMLGGVAAGLGFGFGGYHLTAQPDGDQRIVEAAAKMGLPVSVWRTAMPAIDRAAVPNGGAITPDEYEAILKMAKATDSSANSLALMALSNRPPTDGAGALRRLMPKALASTDPAMQRWYFSAMWEFGPAERQAVREAAAQSPFPEVRTEVSSWRSQ